MGVHGLMNLISECGTFKSINNYENKTVIIDAMQILYKYGIAIRKTGRDLMTHNEHVKSHIFAIFNTAMFLLQKHLRPIFVFDGRTTSLKTKTVNQRASKKTMADKKIKGMNNDSSKEFIKNFKKSFNISNIHIKECQGLLDTLGIPYVQSPGEADPQCVAIEKYLDNAFIMSDDTDILAFGGKTIVKRNKNNYVVEYKLDNILRCLTEKANTICKEMNMDFLPPLTHENFIDLCILLGTDYCQRVDNSTPEQVFARFIVSCYNIETYVKKCVFDGINFNVANYLEKINDIKDYYYNACILDPQTLDLSLLEQSRDNAVNMLCRIYSFDYNYVYEHLIFLDYMYKEYNECIRHNEYMKNPVVV